MADSTETPVLDLLAAMTAGSVEASSLDPETFLLVRIAALIAVDAPPISYVLNLGAASDLDVDADQVAGVLAAVAPIVGTARVAAALGHIVKALELELEVAELEAESPPESVAGRGRPTGLPRLAAVELGQPPGDRRRRARQLRSRLCISDDRCAQPTANAARRARRSRRRRQRSPPAPRSSARASRRSGRP